MVVAFKKRQEDLRWSAPADLALAHNAEAEEAVLGGVLIDPGAMAIAAPILPKAAAFHITAHQLIWQSCLDLHAEGEPVNLMSVAMRMQASNTLEAIGGAAKLAHLADRTVSAITIDYLAGEVRKKWQQREAARISNRFEEIAADPLADLSEARGYLEEELAKLGVTAPPTLRDAIREAIAANPSASEKQATILKLAGEWKAQPKEVRELWEAIQTEDEQERSRDEVAGELDRLLEAKGARLDISQVLPAFLAEPIKLLANQMGLRPECYSTSILATTGSLFANGTWIRLWDSTDFKVTPNLFAVIVAIVSQYKSPILNAVATHPLAILQAEAKRQFEANLQRYEKLLAEWEREKKRGDGDPGEKPVKPAQRLYFFDNSTSEGVAAQLAAQPEAGLLNLVDELAGKFKSANQYRGGRGSDEEELLSLYDGKGKVSLRASGIKVDLPDGLNYGLLGSIQPKILQQFLANCEDSNGNWARFLFVNQPKQYALWESDNGGYDLTDRLAGIYRKISRLPARTYTLSAEAKRLFRDERNRLEQLRCFDSRPAMANYWGKAIGRLGKFALCLHALHSLSEGDICPIEIPAQRMREAIALNHFYADQLLSLCGDFEDSEALPPKLAKIVELAAAKGGTISLRDISRSTNWKSSQVREVCTELEKMRRGQLIEITRPGKVGAIAFQISQPVGTCQQPVSNLSATPLTGYCLENQGIEQPVSTCQCDFGSFPTTIPDPPPSPDFGSDRKLPLTGSTSTDTLVKSPPGADSTCRLPVGNLSVPADRLPDPDPWSAIAAQDEAIEQEYLAPPPPTNPAEPTPAEQPPFKVGDRVRFIDPEFKRHGKIARIERSEGLKWVIRFEAKMPYKGWQIATVMPGNIEIVGSSAADWGEPVRGLE